jgi:2-oxoglutarate ferredoxin oxidoreductase subunit beta
VNEEYDIEDAQSALDAIAHHTKEERILTGLLYIKRDSDELHDVLQTATKPLNTMNQRELCPGSRFLDSINAGLR